MSDICVDSVEGREFIKVREGQKSENTAVGIRCADQRDTLYPQKLG
jgi:hypothetical protein